MADSDSDTILGLDQTHRVRQRKSSNEAKSSTTKLNMIPLRSRQDGDERADAKWIQTPSVGVRR